MRRLRSASISAWLSRTAKDIGFVSMSRADQYSVHFWYVENRFMPGLAMTKSKYYEKMQVRSEHVLVQAYY